MEEPKTDDEYHAALEAAGYRLIDNGSCFSVQHLERGGCTRLDSEDLSSALWEAWNLVRPE